jgi:hypothetical protein
MERDVASPTLVYDRIERLGRKNANLRGTCVHTRDSLERMAETRGYGCIVVWQSGDPTACALAAGWKGLA